MRAAAIVGLLAAMTRANAQSAPGVSIAGVAFDSLRHVPLVGAVVNLAGTSPASARTATSDTRGLFRFDSVAPGTYSVVLYHATLDSVGLSGIATKTTIRGARDTIRVFSPSFTALWRGACGTATPPADSGFVFGSVRDAEREAPVPDATITLSWTFLSVDSTRAKAKSKGSTALAGITRQRWGGDVHSDSRGNYAVCGVPTDVALQVAGTKGTSVTALLDLPPLDQKTRIQRRDLMLGSETPATGGRRRTGVIAGLVQRSSGEGVAGARLMVDGLPQVRSGDGGHFVIPNVPLGTRQIDVMSVGSIPFAVSVDVTAKDTAVITISLQRVTALDPVKVTARTARERRFEEIEERRAQGLGVYLDSTRVGVHNSIVNALSMIVKPADVCAVILDGVKYFGPDMAAELKFRSPQDIALIEVYRYDETPMQYKDRRCGRRYAIVWTKLMIR